MEDRLKELRPDYVEKNEEDLEAGKNDETSQMEVQEVVEGQDEMAKAITEYTDDQLKETFETIQQIKQKMKTIKDNMKEIETHYQSLLVATTGDDSATNKELEHIIDETNLLSVEIRNELKAMSDDIKKLSPSLKGLPIQRIKDNLHSSTTAKFLELMTEYEQMQMKYKTKFKERIARFYKTVKPEATETEIEEAVESGDASQAFAIETLQRKDAAKDAYKYIEARNKDIIQLEASVKELHQLFVDLAILVEAQGEILDQIEANVGSAVDYTQKAFEELVKANKYGKRTRKKMCCIVVILIIVFLLLGGGGIILGKTL